MQGRGYMRLKALFGEGRFIRYKCSFRSSNGLGLNGALHRSLVEWIRAGGSQQLYHGAVFQL